MARTRTGISDGFISCGVLERLIDKIYAPSIPQTNEDAGDEVEMHKACARAIGALTYNRTAFRLLYNLVRRDPCRIIFTYFIELLLIFLFFPFIALYDKIIQYGQRSCLPPEFVKYFESERAKGLPVDRY